MVDIALWTVKAMILFRLSWPPCWRSSSLAETESGGRWLRIDHEPGWEVVILMTDSSQRRLRCNMSEIPRRKVEKETPCKKLPHSCGSMTTPKRQ